MLAVIRRLAVTSDLESEIGLPDRPAAKCSGFMPSPDLPSPVSADLFDRALYQQLSEIIGVAMIELVEDFIDSCKRFDARLVETVAAGNPSGFRELCHEIKGSAAMLGFTGLSRLAAEWESGAISGEMPSAFDASTRFKTMVEASRVMVAGIQARGEG